MTIFVDFRSILLWQRFYAYLLLNVLLIVFQRFHKISLYYTRCTMQWRYSEDHFYTKRIINVHYHLPCLATHPEIWSYHGALRIDGMQFWWKIATRTQLHSPNTKEVQPAEKCGYSNICTSAFNGSQNRLVCFITPKIDVALWWPLFLKILIMIRRKVERG